MVTPCATNEIKKGISKGGGEQRPPTSNTIELTLKQQVFNFCAIILIMLEVH